MANPKETKGKKEEAKADGHDNSSSEGRTATRGE
jgi:hypothetical protein